MTNEQNNGQYIPKGLVALVEIRKESGLLRLVEGLAPEKIVELQLALLETAGILKKYTPLARILQPDDNVCNVPDYKPNGNGTGSLPNVKPNGYNGIVVEQQYH